MQYFIPHQINNFCSIGCTRHDKNHWIIFHLYCLGFHQVYARHLIFGRVGECFVMLLVWSSSFVFLRTRQYQLIRQQVAHSGSSSSLDGNLGAELAKIKFLFCLLHFWIIFSPPTEPKHTERNNLIRTVIE